MRLRMPKVQAKIIILVIWSAALITSLPTAILSVLTPPLNYLDTATPTTTSSINQSDTVTKSYTTELFYALPITEEDSNWTIPPSLSSPNSTRQTTTSGSLTIPSSPTIGQNMANSTMSQQYSTTGGQQNSEVSKQFCQESWTFWPRGKYYYSMALMILQFALPLFVLVITYTRIVIVVWGKRMPGEEDDARDARMARSKRKVNSFMVNWIPLISLTFG